MDIYADLEAEDDRLEGILAGLDDAAWLSPSAAPGWTIVDVVLHLAQSDEWVVVSAGAPADDERWRTRTASVDDMVEGWVQEERAAPAEVFARWRASRRAEVDALRAADPKRPLPWVAASLKPVTLATTRLAEHWAHALDIVGPLGIELPDTDRLRHIAWLGHATLPYAFAIAGQEAHPVFCELTGPNGDSWQFGPPEADSRIAGSAGAFCRVGAQRLAPEDSGLETSGPHGEAALRMLRNYAA